MKKTKPQSIVDIRGRITELQKKLLTEIWNFYVETGTWISIRNLHSRFSKSAVKDAFSNLGGSVAYETREDGKVKYGLTIVGALLTDRWRLFEKLICDFLNFLRKKFISDPDTENISNTEIEKELNINAELSRILCRLLYISPFGSCGLSLEGKTWYVQVPSSIDDLPEVDDVLEYMRVQVMAGYDPGVPIDEIGRTKNLFSERNDDSLSLDSPPSLTGFVSNRRIKQLVQIKNTRFDLRRLIRLCEELNICWKKSCFYAVTALNRAIVDHVPPIFGCKVFSQVTNNYGGGGRSFKEAMVNLDKFSRKIADSHLHAQIRKKEMLPTETQVNFSQVLDKLLEEIVRLLQ